MEASVEGQAPPVLLHHGPGVPPLPAAEQVEGGECWDVGHAPFAGAEAMTEDVCKREAALWEPGNHGNAMTAPLSHTG